MKRSAPRLLVVLLATLAILASAATAAYARTVRVGVYENEPKIYTDDEGEPAGIFIDLLEAIANEEGWTLEYVEGTWQEDLAALEGGEIDLMPDVAYSKERDELYDFHKTPVVESWSYVYAGPATEIERLSQLSGKRVAVLKGSIQESEFKRLAEGFGYDIELVPVGSLAEGFAAAQSGKVDAAIANYLNGDYFYHGYGLVKTPIVFNAVPLFYATAEGTNDDLLGRIDVHLNVWLKEPGSVYYQTLARYTGAVPTELMPPYALWIISGIGALLILASGVILLLRWRVEVQTRNLTEATKSAEEARETLRLAIDAAEQGIFDWDPLTGAMKWTAHNFEMLGYVPDEFEVDFDKWTSMVHPDDTDEVLRAVREGIASPERSFSVEYRMRKKDGDYIWVASHGKAVEVDDEGQVKRVVGTDADVSERKQAHDLLAGLNIELEDRVNERTSRLAAANQDLESFSYSVSHDLRAPLRAISGFSQIVAKRHREDLNDEGRHYIDNIVQASERMGILIDDLLTYSRLGRQAVEIEEVPLSEVVSASVSDLSQRMDSEGVTVNVAEDLPVVAGDRTLLSQIFTNLLENAVTYRRTDVPGVIDITWQDEGDKVVVGVGDNGIGIPAEYHEKVFNIFQRLHSDDEYPGTGIGLANVKKCVQMLSGTISLTSKPGSGTTFYVGLPKEA